MNIIIIGCGKVGAALAMTLAKESHNIAVIDTEKNAVNFTASRADVIGVEGNGVSVSVQREAGIDRADVVIASTGSDEVNLLCCLIARKSNRTVKTIARVRNPIYLDEVSFFKEELGLTRVINPERAAAREIARLLRFPSAMKIDTLSGGMVELLKFKIAPDSPIKDKRIMDIAQNVHSEVLICAIERDNEVIIPNGSTMLLEGDRVSFIASPKNAAAFFHAIKIETHAVKDTLIIGGGRVGYYLAQRLLPVGIDVKIIEKDRKRCTELDELLKGATIINGDGTEETVVMEEGIETAESVVALTNIDEENILLSLFAKKHNEKAKIVTKVNRMMFDSIVEEIELGTIIHTMSIVADNVAATVRAMQNSMGRSRVESLVNILDGKAEALEFVIREPSEATDKPLQQMKLKKNLLVACIMRRKEIIYPRGGDEIKVGDKVVIVTGHQGLNDITDILQSTGGRES